MKRTFVLPVVLAVAVFLPACGGDDDGTTVDVTLQEFAVSPSTSSVSAGEVTFDATNDGPNDPHELVVIRTDLAITDLPTGDDGAVLEDGDGIEVIGEIEEFPVGETQTATYDLDAGAYVLICNIVEVEDGEDESHYQEGMRAAFTVT
jgi:uncharacterized cupredoxin-like copper-binding protein